MWDILASTKTDILVKDINSIAVMDFVDSESQLSTCQFL